jgi:lipoprotein signal peptidase
MAPVRPSITTSPALQRLARLALLVAAGDLVSKFAAERLWSSDSLHVTRWLSLTVVQNHGGAFGLSAGPYTWQLNLALTVAALLVVVPVTRDLTELDPKAPVALGLIAGGALGNLVSLLAPPAGVGDFIAIHWSQGGSLVLNLADLAAYCGLALILRTGFRITHALVTQTRRRPERLGSLFAARAQARQQMKRVRIAPVSEVLVSEWDRVVEAEVVVADAPPVDAPQVEIAPLPRAIIPYQPEIRFESPALRRLDD